jgi:hypothetical protein
MSENENERQYRVLHQMISMHSCLGQRYERRALLLNCSLLVAAVFLCSLNFAADDFFIQFGIDVKQQKLLIGINSALVFALTILELRVRWPQVSTRHLEGKDRLVQLQLKYRRGFALSPPERVLSDKDLANEYAEVLKGLPEIPDSQFTKLRAAHLFNEELIKAATMHPTIPVFFLTLLLRWRGIKNVVKLLKDKSESPK